VGEYRQIRGVVGQITWSYYVAAAIHGYTVRQHKQTGASSLVGTVVSADTFRLTQAPLQFVAPHAKGEWRWNISTLKITDGTVHATLTPIKETVQ
jgi:hypothetical protein